MALKIELEDWIEEIYGINQNVEINKQKNKRKYYV